MYNLRQFGILPSPSPPPYESASSQVSRHQMGETLNQLGFHHPRKKKQETYDHDHNCQTLILSLILQGGKDP